MKERRHGGRPDKHAHLAPSHSEQKLQAPEIRTSVLSVLGGWGTSLVIKLLLFSGSIFSAKKNFREVCVGGGNWNLFFSCSQE